jgi:3-oxoacyl-[acyl-carrier protein] reductase
MNTAVVTGGAGGIGAAICEALCRQGYSVIINFCHSKENAEKLAARLCGFGYDAVVFGADVSRSDEADALIDFAFSYGGRLDLLVNNAGVSLRTLFDLTSDEQWRRITDINLTGVFNCSRAAVKYMLSAKNGRIINISSMWGQTGGACEVAYSASKAGVIGLTKALAKELAPSGITVNCICPGVIDTPMMSGFSNEDKSLIAEDIPVGKFGTPEDVANAVAFLASDSSSYITGQVIGVNGGSVI